MLYCPAYEIRRYLDDEGDRGETIITFDDMDDGIDWLEEAGVQAIEPMATEIAAAKDAEGATLALMVRP